MEPEPFLILISSTPRRLSVDFALNLRGRHQRDGGRMKELVNVDATSLFVAFNRDIDQRNCRRQHFSIYDFQNFEL